MEFRRRDKKKVPDTFLPAKKINAVPTEPNAYATALCSNTHALISSGKCPWCGLTVGAATADSQILSWDLGAILFALRHGDHGAREAALANMSVANGLSVNELVTLLLPTIRDLQSGTRRFAEDILLLAGCKMSQENAAELERRIAVESDGLVPRIPLLSYYSTNPSLPENRDRRVEIVLWLIENEPDSLSAGSPFAHVSKRTNQAGYELVKSAWLRQTLLLNATATTLRNAAALFAHNDAVESQRLRILAASLEHSREGK